MNTLHHTQHTPFVLTIAPTKGGSAKSTNAANLGGFCAEHGLKTLLIDTDIPPTLTSYYALEYATPGGIYQFLIDKNAAPEVIISKTVIPNKETLMFYSDNHPAISPNPVK